VLKIKSNSFVKQFRQLSVILIVKKGISILFAFVMIATMFHLSVATHYCGGKLAASKISLSGKLANCGMEGSENKLPLQGLNFSKHCCDDVITVCGTGCNYIPSISFIPESYQYNFAISALPAELAFKSLNDQIHSLTNVNPPGVLMSTSVDLPDICVFRI
jgi:hypothetical protein